MKNNVEKIWKSILHFCGMKPILPHFPPLKCLYSAFWYLFPLFCNCTYGSALQEDCRASRWMHTMFVVLLHLCFKKNFAVSKVFGHILHQTCGNSSLGCSNSFSYEYFHSGGQCRAQVAGSLSPPPHLPPFFFFFSVQWVIWNSAETFGTTYRRDPGKSTDRAPSLYWLLKLIYLCKL